jgi:hypothetical protein
MATPAQFAANRANAKKSSGPKTPEGKAKSCLNHTSYGFNSATLFIPLEEQEDFNGLLSALLNEFQPATPHEQILVERMVRNQWHSLRAIRLQSISLKASVPLGFTHKDLGVLVRYQTAADRTYDKSHSELLKAQKERVKSAIGFESEKAAGAAQPPATPETTVEKAASAGSQGTEIVTEIPDFTPFEHKIAAELGMDIEELKRAA